MSGIDLDTSVCMHGEVPLSRHSAQGNMMIRLSAVNIPLSEAELSQARQAGMESVWRIRHSISSN